jgi:hypothetical protein
MLEVVPVSGHITTLAIYRMIITGAVFAMLLISTVAREKHDLRVALCLLTCCGIDFVERHCS